MKKILIMAIILATQGASAWEDELAIFESEILSQPEVKKVIKQGYDCYMQDLPKELQGKEGIILIYPKKDENIYHVYCQSMERFFYEDK